jgi:PAS domain S-box-containing protein
MKLHITVLIPALLLISTLVSGLILFNESLKLASLEIHKTTRERIKLDITRLQNILYNRLTEGETSEARLNLSITAMDSSIQSLILTDEKDKILFANRYSWEGELANTVTRYDLKKAELVRRTNHAVSGFSPKDDSIFEGTYPVILQLENSQGLPIKRVGTLYVEVSIASKLAAARNAAIKQSSIFGGIMLGVTISVALLLHLLVSRRLNKLTRASEELASGNFDINADIGGHDELSQLGKSFDKMVQQLKQDIQRRHDAEKELRNFNEKLERAVNLRTIQLQTAQQIASLGNWNWDVQSGNIDWSDEVYRIFGFSPGSISPSYNTLLECIHPDDLEQFKSEFKSLDKSSDFGFDVRIKTQSGETKWVHIEGIPSTVGDNNEIYISGTIQDITERKLAEQSLIAARDEAQHASQAKSIFLSRMSHELRTPMNAILGFTQILGLELEDPEYQQHIAEIMKAGDHLLNLIEELLDLGRIETGQLAITLKSVDIAEVLDDSIQIVRPTIEKHKLTLINEYQGKDLLIADSTRVKQILVNLLNNAAKYNKEGGTISVNCQRTADDHLRVSITDSGRGIDTDKLEHLFKPFERLGMENEGIDGTGIGLSLSKQFIELMAGKIGVDSTPGLGSTFWFELPLASADNLPGSLTHKPEIPAVNILVLYIEDNLANLRVVEAIFAKFPDLTLISATTGKRGLELAREYQPNIVLLDINLPDINGYEVLRRLQDSEHTQPLPVIALSADGMPLDIERGLKAGFKEYLTKPVKVNELITALKTHNQA